MSREYSRPAPDGFRPRNASMSQRNRDDMAAYLEGGAYWIVSGDPRNLTEANKQLRRLAALVGTACRLLEGREATT